MVFNIQSSNIVKVGYVPAKRVMFVQFVKGGVYAYAGVASCVFSGILKTPSAGRYFTSYIKNAHPCKRVA